MHDDAVAPTGALSGIKVLDLSRILAGPWSSQILGDLGADVIKIEEQTSGDDTRQWGPPFMPDGSGDSAYHMCANRNKRSVAIDIASDKGAKLVLDLVAKCDIVVENFRVGGLARYGLDYDSLRKWHPALIYCSITGFGQDGPYKDRGGYDFLIQGMSGLMSITGRPDGAPGGGAMKVGVPVSDLFTGLYATVAILAALRHRDRTGKGQHIDAALLDTQVSLLTNQTSNYLNGGVVPRRLANEHPNMVPYRDFATADDDVIIALGNDRQFVTMCAVLGIPELARDPRFQDVAGRNLNRAALYIAVEPLIAGWRSDALLAAMEAAKLPAGRINDIPEALNDPQVVHRGLVRTMTRSNGAEVEIVGFPMKLSRTPATYRHAPPRHGEDTEAVLKDLLGRTAEEIEALMSEGVIATPQAPPSAFDPGDVHHPSSTEPPPPVSLAQE